jgi:hypothetical protein
MRRWDLSWTLTFQALALPCTASSRSTRLEDHHMWHSQVHASPLTLFCQLALASSSGCQCLRSTRHQDLLSDHT